MACQSQPTKPTAQPVVSKQPQKPPFQAELNPPQRLSRDLIFNYLAGEIALQRGYWQEAFDFLLKAAVEAQDAVAASQAARMAWREKQKDKAYQAVQLWIEYDPNSFSARQMALLLEVERGDFERALEQADALLKISRYQGKDDFLLLASVLLAQPNTTALKIVEYFARQNPHSAGAQYGEALLASELKDYQRSEQAIERALKLKPDWDKPYLLRVRNHSQQNRLDLAEQVLDQALQCCPSLNLWKSYGRLMVQKKDHRRAMQAFEQAYQLKKDVNLLYTIGLLAMQAGDWSKARQVWQDLAAQTEGKQRDEAYYFLGQVEENQAQIQAAIQAYQKVTEASRLKRDARFKIAMLTLKQGRYQQAHALFKLLRQQYPDQNTAFLMSELRTLKQMGQAERALKILYEEAQSGDPDMIYTYGLFASDLGQIEEAERAFKKVLQLRPDDADALNALGYTLTNHTQRYQEAYAYIERALQLQPQNPAILDSMGWVLYRMGKPEQALIYLKQAAQRLDDAEILAHLIEVLQHLGQQQEAQHWIKYARQRYPHHHLLKPFYGS